MQTGTFNAFPTNVIVDKAKSGNQFLKVFFDVKVDGEVKKLNWTGWLTVKAMKNTLTSMFKVGMTSKKLRMLMDGHEGAECLNVANEVEVTVAKQKDQDGNYRTNDDGQPYYEVSFIGGANMKSNKDALDSLDRAALMSQMMKIEETTAKTTSSKVSTNNEIPF